ncbi:Flagellum-specific ATP synthase [Adhaeretor mobilis]|uniref:Flagellum-specific ATP synthase n=2 Tax=Adhaeretor mobilis TaxID=1930276 RepID=A0A517MYT5_9BACT|nr:Flagellum-specific ATP synthase [Adhaeretor mobilis]
MLSGLTGSVVQTIGLTAAVADFPVPVGALVSIDRQAGEQVEAEVVGFRENHTLVMPLSNLEGIRRGSRVKLVRTSRTLKVGDGLLGRVVDARGRCIDGRPQPMLRQRLPLEAPPLVPTERVRIDTPLGTGVKAIDGMLTAGQGQRLGIFAGSGVGKSVLMGTMAKHTEADVTVVALIGERGREVNEFIQRELGPEGLARSVVVAATSNEPALLRVQAAYAATTIAEYFRDQGKNVLLIMDSVTRFALAQREIGLAAGEPPATRGFPPSTFAILPKLVERAGRSSTGSITAFYTVLVEGDDENEPIADAMRGLLDGHVWLSRKLAERGHYPAINVLGSISRLMNELSTPEGKQAAQIIRELLAVYAENEDLVTIGAYRKGANPRLDAAVAMRDSINAFLCQQIGEQYTLADAQQQLVQLAAQVSVNPVAPDFPTETLENPAA